MKKFDIICIGSGVSALYFAYRAAIRNEKQSILILSQDAVIGGRIRSRTTFDAQVPYKTEICATRFYQNDHSLLFNTAVALGNPLTFIPANDLPVVTLQFPQILAAVDVGYPVGLTELERATSLNIAVTQTSNFDNVSILARSIGYRMLEENNNLLSFRADPLNDQDEVRFVRGFESFCESLYCQFKNVYPIVFNYTVRTIEFDNTSLCYMINNDFLCKKVIYTGTVPQFFQLNTTSHDLQQRRALIPQLYNVLPSFKCYLYFEKPWWGDLLYKFTGHPLLTQVFFYTPNIILVYIIGNITANTLRELAGLNSIRACDSKCPQDWVDASLHEPLVSYIQEHLLAIMQSALPQYQTFPLPTPEQINSVTKVLPSFVDQALLLPKPMSACEPNDVYDRVQAHNNFYYLSGDLTADGGGWVNKCLLMVEKYLDDILDDSDGASTSNHNCNTDGECTH